jgi:hypothetical protein
MGPSTSIRNYLDFGLQGWLVEASYLSHLVLMVAEGNGVGLDDTSISRCLVMYSKVLASAAHQLATPSTPPHVFLEQHSSQYCCSADRVLHSY